MKKIAITVLCSLFFSISSFNVYAAERYISDILIVSLREAPNRTSNIIGHLRSGDYMTILEEQDNGYVRVLIPSGLEGWIPKKYTSEGKSKDSVIRGLKKTIVKLEKINNLETSKSNAMTSQIMGFQANLDGNATREAKQLAHIEDLAKQVTEAQDKYITLKDQAEGVEAIYAENTKIHDANEILSKELKVLKMEIVELDQTKNIFWFLAGAVVLLIGCIIGRSGRKNRRNSLTM